MWISFNSIQFEENHVSDILLYLKKVMFPLKIMMFNDSHASDILSHMKKDVHFKYWYITLSDESNIYQLYYSNWWKTSIWYIEI